MRPSIARNPRTLRVAALASFACTLGAPALAQDVLIPAPLTQPGLLGPFNGAEFGQRIAAEGDLLVVGAPIAKSTAGDTGAAFVYRLVDDDWVLEAELLPSAPQVGSRIGIDVDTDGQRVIVGADFADLDDAVDGEATGGAFIFEQVGGTWTEVGVLVPQLPDPTAQFGTAVAIDGDVALMASEEGLRPVPVYRRDAGGAWNLEGQLLPPAASLGSGFGVNVDVSGDRLMIGASNVTKDGVDLVGAISWWQYANGIWVDRGLLQPPAEPFLYSGLEFALDGDILLVGHPFVSTDGVFSAGRASVFVKGDAGWEHTFLTDGPINSFGQFGRSVDIDNGRLLVGQRAWNSLNRDEPGRVHLYEQSSAGWARVRTEFSPATELNDNFGDSVALVGDDALVGAPLADTPFQNAGQVWAFDMRPMSASADPISLSAGGTQSFKLVAGPERAGWIYLISGSVTGTSPGIPVDGVVVPLALDAYTLSLLSSFGGLPIPMSLGFLDADGRATAELIVPAGTDPTLAGVVGYHAFLTLNPFLLLADFASNAVTVDLVP